MKRRIGVLGQGTKTPPEVLREGLTDVIDVEQDCLLLPWFGIEHLRDDWEIIFDWALTSDIEVIIYTDKDDLHPLIRDAATVTVISGEPVMGVASNAATLLYLWGTDAEIPKMLEQATYVPTPPKVILDLTNGLVPIIVEDTEEPTTTSENLSRDELEIMPASFVKSYAQERTGTKYSTKTDAMGALFGTDDEVDPTDDNPAPSAPVVASTVTDDVISDRISKAVAELVEAITESIIAEIRIEEA